MFYKMLIDQIEASGFSFYQQSFSPKVKNWQPFYWMGYEQKTLYTFCINHPYSLAEAEKNFSKSTRQSLRRASQAYTISELDDVVLFYKLHCMTYTRKNREAPFAFSLIQRIYKACKENGAVKMLFMQDGEKNICSTLLLVYDAKNVYSLMSGLSQEKRSNNIFGLLEYEGIKFACETGRCYDFEGSMLEGVSKYNRGFGAEMYPYYGVRKVLTKTPILRQYLKYRLHAL